MLYIPVLLLLNKLSFIHSFNQLHVISHIHVILYDMRNRRVFSSILNVPTELRNRQRGLFVVIHKGNVDGLNFTFVYNEVVVCTPGFYICSTSLGDHDYEDIQHARYKWGRYKDVVKRHPKATHIAVDTWEALTQDRQQCHIEVKISQESQHDHNLSHGFPDDSIIFFVSFGRGFLAQIGLIFHRLVKHMENTLH